MKRLSIPLITLLLAACGSTPPGGGPLSPLEQRQVDLGGGIRVEYQIERKTSSVNSKACYAFITGHLVNQSAQTLSRQTILDFNVLGGGRQIFRDLTSPVGDVAPGTRVMFGMIDSPVHKDGCPPYERIEIGLRKVIAG